MVTNAFLAVICLAVVVNAHSTIEDVQQSICSKNNPCPAPAVCCLTAYQGRCYYGSSYRFFGYTKTDPEESATCLLDTSLNGGNLIGSKCSKDSDCDKLLVCNELRSNRWGECADHICDASTPCKGRKCNKDATGPGFSCNCENDENGNLINDKSWWTRGKLCDEAHPCADEDVHLCGDHGTCLRDPTDPEAEVCECAAEWFGEKCNWEGACQKEGNVCVQNSMSTRCVSASTTEYTCHCNPIMHPNFGGKNCDEANRCGESFCNGGKCINDNVKTECTDTIFYTNSGKSQEDRVCTYTVTSHCQCRVNYYGSECSEECGGATLVRNLVIGGETDAICVYEDLQDLDGNDGVKVQVNVSMIGNDDSNPDDLCNRYYVEAYLKDDETPTVAESETSTDLNRYCKPFSTESAVFTWSTNDISRIVLSAEKGTYFQFWTFFDDKWYLYFDEEMIYLDAMQTCEDNGAYLTTAKTEDENTFLGTLNESGDNLWLGLASDDDGTVWMWNDDTTLDWNNWMSGSGISAVFEYHVGVRKQDTTWVSEDDLYSTTNRFICKK